MLALAVSVGVGACSFLLRGFSPVGNAVVVGCATVAGCVSVVSFVCCPA